MNDPRKKKLLLADMDGTIIKEESLDEIAGLLGIKNEVKKITSMAMNGDIQFEEALFQRVKLLKNLPLKVIMNYRDSLSFSDGGIEMISSMKSFGAKTVYAEAGKLETVMLKFNKFSFLPILDGLDTFLNLSIITYLSIFFLQNLDNRISILIMTFAVLLSFFSRNNRQ